jgi:SpoVK/Ycf46/Vps4 family AAA+-type ATPase
LSVVRSRAELEAKGIKVVTNLLLYGPPGCGKTHLARFIAHELKLPLYLVRLDGLVSSFLGSTSKNIRAVLEFASRTPCVLLLDEFDAIAKVRDDQQELGELKRIVNSFLQNLDALGTDVTLIAATNHEQLLDPAVWRRFHYQVQLDLPEAEQREKFWEMFSGDVVWSPKELKVLADLSDGFSVAAIETVMTRLRQRLIVHLEKPNLRDALISLGSLAEGKRHEQFALSQAPINDPRKLAKQLRARNPQLYSLAMIGEVAGRSTATMSRLGAAEKSQLKRKGNGR